MSKIRKASVAFLVGIVLVSGAFVTGCTSYATPEQLARISELEKEISSLEASIQGKQAQIGTVERQISSQQAKLDQCAKDKELVKQRLANWKGN